MASAWRAWVAASLRDAGWAPTLVFLAHVVASDAFGAYERFPPLDIPMHILGGIAISFFIGRSYGAAERLGLLGHPFRWLYFVVVFALATTATVLWEFAEYISDRYFGTHAQLGLRDTLLDMLLGCLGSLFFLVAHAAASGRVARTPAAARDGDV
jgi:hypothetical protein